VRQRHRSAIAVVAASLLGGTAVGAATAHLSGQTQQEAVSASDTAPAATAATADMGARIHELLLDAHQMNSTLVTSRSELVRQLRELTRLRQRVAADRVDTLTATPGAAPPAAAVSPPPPAHTTTGASGASAPPPAHTTTGASGANPPPSHTTTGASGAGGTGGDHGEHDKEHSDD
jgi:hypothetical protein